MKKLIIVLILTFVITGIKAQCPITILPSNPTTCSGSPIVLTASAANSYTWSANAGGANTATVSVSPAANTTYTVTAFTGTCSATAIVTVNVNPLPIVTVNSTTLCSSYSATLTAGGAVTYTWSTGAVLPSIVMSPTTTTTYTVVGEDGNGCKNFAVSTVTVLPSPTLTVNSAAICSGSATLTAGVAATYTWSTNAGSVNTNTVVVNPASTTVYTITGSFPNTCSTQATSTVYVNSSTVTITPPAGTNYCTNSPYQFTGNANPGPILSWQWYCTPSANVNIQNPTQSGTNITFYQTGNYVLTVIANNSLGCRDSALFPLTVTQTPTVSAIPIAPIICLGGPGTTLISTVIPNFGPTTYTWNGTGMIQYANGDSANINPATAGIYTYTLQGTQNGCISQPITITATVSPAPTPTLIAGPDTICSTGTTTITAYGMPSTTSYTWIAPATGGLGTNSGYFTWVTPVFSAPYDTTFKYQTNFYVPGCPAYPTYTTNVVVLATPIVDAVADTVDNCNKKGDSLRVTSIPPISSGVTFSWTPSTGLNTTVGSIVFANPLNPTWYYVTPSYRGCIGLKDSIRMLIGDTTSARIDAQYLITCTGKPDTLVGLPGLNQLNNSYQYYWQPSIGPSAPVSINANNDTVIVKPIATTVYTLTVRGTCVKRQKYELTIYVNNCGPIVFDNFTETSDTICVNHCIYFTDLTHNSNVLPLFYEWIFVGGNAYGSTGGYTVHLPDTAYYAATDSTPIPSIKVCYHVNSSLNTGGVFPVTMMVSHGPPGSGMPSYTVVHNVKVDAGPLSNAGPNVTINLGDSTQLDGTHSSGNFAISTYSWTPPDSLSCPPSYSVATCPKPWANPSETTIYYLTVTDANGCKSTDSMVVYVDLKCYDPFIPSAFSPNGDMKNDVLYVRSNCLENFTFKVFDRWGEKVFESSTLNFGWDGTVRNVAVNAGVFVWTLEGFLSNGKEVKKHGSTTVIR